MSRPYCWLARHGMHESGEMPPCDGRLVRVHLIPRRLLKLEGSRASIADPRSYVLACGGVTGMSGHHGAFDYARTLRVARHRLPSGFEELCAELGLTWWVDREYGPDEPSSSGHGDDA